MPKPIETLMLSRVQELPRCPVTPVLAEALERLKTPNADPRDLAAHIERAPELAEEVVAAMARQTGRRIPDVLGGLRLLGLKALEQFGQLFRSHTIFPILLSNYIGFWKALAPNLESCSSDDEAWPPGTRVTNSQLMVTGRSSVGSSLPAWRQSGTPHPPL